MPRKGPHSQLPPFTQVCVCVISVCVGDKDMPVCSCVFVSSPTDPGGRKPTVGTKLSQSAGVQGPQGQSDSPQPTDRNMQGEDPRCPPRDSRLTHVHTHG